MALLGWLVKQSVPHGGGWGVADSLHALLHRLPGGHQAAPSGRGQLLRQARNPLTGTERGNRKPGICGGFLLQSPFHHQAAHQRWSGKDWVASCVTPPSFSSHIRLCKVLAPPPLLPLLIVPGLDSQGRARSRSENT